MCHYGFDWFSVISKYIVYECRKASGDHMMTYGPWLLNLSSHFISGRELEKLEELPLNAADPKYVL